MNERIIKRRNRQIGVAQCILEGKSIRETAKEYSISKETVKRDLDELYWDGYGRDDKEINKNKLLAYKALKMVESRKKEKNS